MNKKTVSINGGCNAAFLLTILFIGLKLSNIINWSWWWVFCPIWLGWAVFIAIFVAVLAVIALALICAAIVSAICN